MLRRCLLAVALVVLVPDSARAHGRAAELSSLSFDPDDPASIVALGSFGTVRSHDGGATWTWQCAEALGYRDDPYDPQMEVLPGGEMLVGTFDGAYRSTAGGCAWSRSIPQLESVFTLDVVRAPDGAVWALTSPGATPDTLWRSTDGSSFTAALSLPLGSLHDRMVFAPSDPLRVYTAGVYYATDDAPRRAIVRRSEDGARTQVELPFGLEGEERTIHVLAVDPRNPDRVFARTVGPRPGPTIEPRDRIVVSDDGGATWSDALVIGAFGGFALDPSGDVVWVGEYEGGLHRSDDGGRTFTRIHDTLRVRCLTSRPGELWVCADGRVLPHWAIARSVDGGETLEPMLRYADLENETGCAAGSTVGDLCPMWWADLQFDLGLTSELGGPDGGMAADAGASDASAGDAGITAPTPRGCACAAAGSRSSALGPLLSTMVAAMISRRRRGRARIGHEGFARP